MKWAVTSLFLTIPAAIATNCVSTSTKVTQKSSIILQSSAKLKNIRNNLLWYVERHGYGWIPGYSIDFTRKFFVNAIEFLEELSLKFNFWKTVDEKIYNEISGGKFFEDKKTISSELSKVSTMSFGFFGGTFIAGPLCTNLKTRFWNSWDPIFNNVEKAATLQKHFYI